MLQPVYTVHYKIQLYLTVDSLNRTQVGIIDKSSSSQLLDFIRSEGKGDFL